MLVVKVHRQHNSLKITIPYCVREKLNIKAGDYLGMDICEPDKEVTVFKIQNRRPRDGESTENQSRDDKSGGA